MEFRGVINLDLHTANLLSQYLIDKESDLSLKIMETIGPVALNFPEPLPPNSKDNPLKLGDAVLLFGKKIRTLSTNREIKPAKGMWKIITSQINIQCWAYLQILENIITELFIQIKLLDITKWKNEMLDAAYSIKMTLMHHLEDLEWALKRLNAQIWQLRLAEDESCIFTRLKHLFSYFNLNIESSLLVNLQKSRKFLSFKYGKFHDVHTNYQKLHQDVRKPLLKFIDYHILNHLDAESKDSFTKLYELLKMWKINVQSKLIPSSELRIPLRNLIDPKRVSHIFEEYHTELLKEIYIKSRFFKTHSHAIIDDESVETELADSLIMTHKEIHLLAATTRNYRDFLLKTDPNPYIRCRFGFGEWTVGKEPALTKNMLLLSYEIAETNKYAEHLIDSLKSAKEKNNLSDFKEKSTRSEKILHEMSQPLIGESTMRSLAEGALEEIKSFDELGSFDIHIVDYIGVTLSKILKSDWKYHVLFDIPFFKTVYSNHINIVGLDQEDRLHLNRLNEFSRLFKEIKDLVKVKYLYRSNQEIDLHLNDIKGTLQDFLGYVQRVTQDKNSPLKLIKNIRFQLLEYRYFFGQYFHDLGTLDIDKQMISNKFLFVNQYLDVVDSLLEPFSDSP